MKMIQISFIASYLLVNFLVGACANMIFFSKTETIFSSFISPIGIIVGIILILIERKLPPRVKLLQVGLSLFFVLIALKGGDQTNRLFFVVGGVVMIIKCYAVKLFIQDLKDKLSGNSNSSLAPVSGKDFYNSQAWRKLRYKVLTAQGRVCACCKITPRETDEPFEVDHIKPRSKYPHLALEESNLQVYCKSCNRGKMADYEIDHRDPSVA